MSLIFPGTDAQRDLWVPTTTPQSAFNQTLATRTCTRLQITKKQINDVKTRILPHLLRYVVHEVTGNGLSIQAKAHATNIAEKGLVSIDTFRSKNNEEIPYIHIIHLFLYCACIAIWTIQYVIYLDYNHSLEDIVK